MITDTRAAALGLAAAKINNTAIDQAQIETALDEAENAIRIYTNRFRTELVTPPDIYAYEALPPEMAYIWANMAADILAGSTAAQSGSGTPSVTTGAIAGSIKSIKEGDVSIEFTDGSGGTVSSDPTARIGGLMYDYESQLQAFRRFGW